MKARLIVFAFALLLLAFAATFIETARDTSSPAKMKIDSQVEAKSTPIAQQRKSASAQVQPPLTGAPKASAPSTEAAALGYLQSASIRSWDLKRGDFSNAIRTLSGGALESKAIVPREAADQFVKFYARGLFGVEPERIQFNREEDTDRTRIIYDQVVDGTPVYGGSLTLFFEGGALTRVQNDLAPYEIDESSRPSPVAQAFTKYRDVQSSMFDVALQEPASNRMVLFPNGRSLVYAYEFVTSESDKGDSGAKSYRVVFDANDSFIIQRRPSAIR